MEDKHTEESHVFITSQIDTADESANTERKVYQSDSLSNDDDDDGELFSDDDDIMTTNEDCGEMNSKLTQGYPLL
jgi:hypothetical protein